MTEPDALTHEDADADGDAVDEPVIVTVTVDRSVTVPTELVDGDKLADVLPQPLAEPVIDAVVVNDGVADVDCVPRTDGGAERVASPDALCDDDAGSVEVAVTETLDVVE